MTIPILKSKIERAVITGVNFEHDEGILIDKKLIDAAKLRQFQKVEVYNLNNGKRFSTYVVEGAEGEISLNGAAARLVQKGDLIIISGYVYLDEKEAAIHNPKIVFVDASNKIIIKVDNDWN
ncbi:MAG: aspartate 1-decarboxylase [Ignavibacteria bacterium]|jgi:aspartate 1-decarboxylase|nr:aspartate 1-decarboxylase [Ignavibacteria bacterium]